MSQKLLSYFASGFFLLVILLLECFPLQREAAEGWQMQQSSDMNQPALAHNHLLRSPDGTLIGWGHHVRGHESSGLPLSSYYFRKNLAADVVDMACGPKNLMYIDQQQNLHGWGRTGAILRIPGCSPEDSEVLTNDRIAENVQSIAVGNSHAAAVTTNGTLYLWGREAGSTGEIEPFALMEQVERVQILSDMTFMFTSNHDLYWYPSWGQTESPERLATNVKEIALLSTNATDSEAVFLQGLRTDGSVFYLDTTAPESLIDFPQLAGVRSLCQQGLVKDDDTLWLWKIQDGQPELLKERDGILSAVDQNQFITTSGHIHLRDPSTLSLPVVHTLRMVYPGMRLLEILLLLGAVLAFRKGRRTM